MEIESVCPMCRTAHQLDSTQVGTSRACTKCGARFIVKAEKRRSAKITGVMFDAVCPKCQATVRVSSMYAGTNRPCTACGASFALRLPEDVKAEIDKRREAPPQATAVKLGCDACGRLSTRQVDPGEPVVACAYCGVRRPAAEAIALADKIEALQKQTLSALLAGSSREDVARSLVAAGLGAPDAARFVEKFGRDLPFVRFYMWQSVQHGVLPPRTPPPPVCDLCTSAPPNPRAPFGAVWKMVMYSEKELSPWSALTIFGGAVVFKTTTESRELRALYYLCDRCGKHLGSRARKLDAYPASAGYEVVKIERLGDR